MRFRASAFSVFLLILTHPFLNAAPHDHVVVPPAKTSIYIGSVTLTAGILQRENGTYHSSYQAKVFPYFFYNEEGELFINFSDEQVAQLHRGERVQFTGTAKNKDGEDRRIEGHVTARAPGATEGIIKVRIFVTKKIELIFNSTYSYKP